MAYKQNKIRHGPEDKPLKYSVVWREIKIRTKRRTNYILPQDKKNMDVHRQFFDKTKR